MLAAAACSRGKNAPGPSPDAGPVAAHAGVAVAGPRFSRPIAAALHANGNGGTTLIVAGLVVPKAAVVAAGLGTDGSVLWTTPVIDGVKWTGAARLSVFAAPEGGAAIAWRGQRGGKDAAVAVFVGPHGELRGAPFDVGAALCATEDGLAWLEHARTGRELLHTRSWAASVDERAGAPTPPDRDALLVCAAHRVYVLAEGERDITVEAPAGADSGGALVLARDQDFSEEEAEHDAYAVGDVLGLVRVSVSGRVAVRETGERLSAWKTATVEVSADDDIVAVDASGSTGVVVFTRDESGACEGSQASSVHALRLARPGATGEAQDAVIDLAPASCGADRGPFWTGEIAGGLVVAWALETRESGAGRAPIAGMEYRALSGVSGAEPRKIERRADEIVPAGCGPDRCYAVALVRPQGEDGMQPEPVEVLGYP